MYILLILIAILLLTGISTLFWISYRKRLNQRLSSLSFFATASSRRLAQDEREAVESYLGILLQGQEKAQPNSLMLNAHSNTVYSVTRAITRYGLTTDEPNKWHYYLDSTEVHLPLFWEHYISDDNDVELIPTATLPLVISLNGYTLQEYMRESRSLLLEHSCTGHSTVQGQVNEQIEQIGVRRETREEHRLTCSNGWQEGLLISVAFMMFFLCLKVPDMLIPWLVFGATLLLLAGLWRIFLPACKSAMKEIHCLRGIPKRWGLFGEFDQEQINAVSLGTLDLIYPAHWQPFIRHELGQKTDIDIYLNRNVVRQGHFLSLHDEVKKFPLQYWVRSSILSAGAFLVLLALIFSVPLEMPFMLTTSWLKGAKTVEATSVGQLEESILHVGDTLSLKGSGMCNIHPGGRVAHYPTAFMPFDCSQIIWNSSHPVPLPESDVVTKATALIQEVNQQLHPQNENLAGINPQLASAIQQAGMILLNDFAGIVLKTQALCTDTDECIRLKNALVNLSNSKDWDSLISLASSGKLYDINVLLRPVSAEALENLVNASVAPFFIRETSRAAQSLNNPVAGGFVIINESGGDLVDQPYPPVSLYDYPAREQWNEFQRLAVMLLQTPFIAEGIVTSIRTDSNNTQYIVLHSIPDSTSVSRYIGTTLLLVSMIICTLYQGIMAVRRRQRNRSRLAKIQRYYEQCLNLQLGGSSVVNPYFN